MALAGAVEASRVHAYTFTAGSRFEGSGVVTAADRAGNASAGTFAVVRDDTPPEVTLSVPRRVYTTTFSISWGAVDAQAGVAGYDLAIKVDDGEWQVLADTQSTSYPFASPTGSHFAFRVTATDRVSNAGSVEAVSRLVEVTKYYYHGSQRVAMRRSPAGSGNGVLTYLHGDHLGSTSLVTNDTGGFVARVLYYPYGEERYTEGTLTTDYQFTAQRKEGFGLYDYQARFYDSSLGRFISADTVVPGIGGQARNRYMYVTGNPLKYADSTGHGCSILVTYDADGNPRFHYFCDDDFLDNLDSETQELVLSASEIDGMASGSGIQSGYSSWYSFPAPSAAMSPQDMILNGDDSSPPTPKSPPDFDSPQPDGAPCPPPDIPGVNPEGWEWREDWGDGRGYKHPDLPGGLWRPDDGYDVGHEGENPHWHGPGDPFPGDYKWGRKGQRKTPGTFNPDRGVYEAGGALIVAGVVIIFLDVITVPSGEGLLGLSLIAAGGMP